MNKHAFLSASGAPAWTLCEIKPWRELGLPEQTSAAAEEGTKAHELLEKCIKNNKNPFYWREYSGEMQDDINWVLSNIADLPYSAVLSEQQLDISGVTGEKDAKGTADIVLLTPGFITIFDLKYGRSLVNAVDNKQLLTYGAAALAEYDLIGDVHTIRMGIIQPRHKRIVIWELSVEEIKERALEMRKQGERILAAKGGDNYLHATPGETQCRYCKVKDTCPERRGFALTTVTDDFVDLDKEEQFLDKVANAKHRLATSDDKHLATCMDAVDLIEDWCKGVRSEMYKRLINNNFSDNRYKLVQGRAGHRAWSDEAAAERKLSHRKDEGDIFIKKLVSPAQLEKMCKEISDTDTMEMMEPFITRSDGKPTIAKQEDKRPAIANDIGFDMIGDEEFIESLAGLTHGEK